jgi:hypothetical protein
VNDGCTLPYLGLAINEPPRQRGEVARRPFRYIREDFFLARSFRNLDHLNGQLCVWLDTLANPRVHATTRRVVNEAFAEERLHLRPLPLAPFQAVLRLERRISPDGMVSIGGNFYSVPDATRRRVVEAHSPTSEVQIFEEGALIAKHLILEGRHQRRVAPGPASAGTTSRRASRHKARASVLLSLSLASCAQSSSINRSRKPPAPQVNRR